MKIPGSGSSFGSVFVLLLFLTFVRIIHYFLVKAVIYGKEKFYGCEKPVLIEKIKNFSLIKLVCVVFF